MWDCQIQASAKLSTERDLLKCSINLPNKVKHSVLEIIIQYSDLYQGLDKDLVYQQEKKKHNNFRNRIISISFFACLLDFNRMSMHLGLIYAKRLENSVHIYISCVVVY